MATLLHGTETLEQAIDRIYHEQTDTRANEVRDADVVAALADWLLEDPARLGRRSATAVARAVKNAYLKRRRPRMLGGQLALFQPYYLIALGKGRHAWMDFATREQVIEWKAALLGAFARTRATHEERIRQIDARLERWGGHKTLGEVERVEFRWTPADFRYDDDADDEDEDDDAILEG